VQSHSSRIRVSIRATLTTGGMRAAEVRISFVGPSTKEVPTPEEFKERFLNCLRERTGRQKLSWHCGVRPREQFKKSQDTRISPRRSGTYI
jgi:hypothetical protein